MRHHWIWRYHSHSLVKGFADSETGELHAVSRRTQESSNQWRKKYNLPKAKCYPSYAAMLVDEEIDTVYVALMNDRHCELTIQAAEAGKHILCENPLAMNHAEVLLILKACRANKVFFMEAFMWRCHTVSEARAIAGNARGKILLNR